MLNFEGYFIGATAWCPNGACALDYYSNATASTRGRARRYDSESHNLLGVLQLVAKALEVWFVFIATSMIYIVTLLLAGRQNGLQVRYFAVPAEYAGLSSLLDITFWTSAASGPKKLRYIAYAYLVFAVALGILCNLTGPAVAVLILPALRWTTYSQSGSRRFVAVQ